MRLAKMAAIGLAALGTVAGSVWGASVFVQTLATKDDLVVVQAQAQSALDRQIEDLVEKLNNARAKPNKTNADVAYIQYLERQLESAKRIREGKIK